MSTCAHSNQNTFQRDNYRLNLYEPPTSSTAQSRQSSQERALSKMNNREFECSNEQTNDYENKNDYYYNGRCKFDRKIYPKAPIAPKTLSIHLDRDDHDYQEVISNNADVGTSIRHNHHNVTNYHQQPSPITVVSQDDSTSVVIYGCVGGCRKFENICYFFLQLIFTMGILIGLSLCIAGIVLRKSAARNLQVLIYIGAILLLVCGLLIIIQWRTRKAKRRKCVIKNNYQNRQQTMDLNILNIQQQQLPQNSTPMTLYRNPMNEYDSESIHPFKRTLRDSNEEYPSLPWWKNTDNVIIL